MILTCTKIQRKVLIIGEVGAPKNCMTIRPAHFVNIK